MSSVGTIAASAARTTSGDSGAIDADQNNRYLSILVDVTAASGSTPTLDVSVEWSNDGVNFAAADTPDSLTQITTAAKRVKQFAVKASQYRVVWTIGGTTPSFTFSVSALEN